MHSNVGSEGAGADAVADNSSDSETDSEDEDDDGVLVSEELDAQIQATLDAIRNKDPRVYDEKTTFYTAQESPLDGATTPAERKAKPMYLRDFHRRNLLQGNADVDEHEELPPTYAQQQDYLRQTVVEEMHGVAQDDPSDLADKSDEDDFLVRKSPLSGKAISGGDKVEDAGGLDPKDAEKDPERFLSTFMSAKAWIPSAGSKFQPFESDDEDDDQRAEAFEEAYNLRFEDPKGANEKLLSHARDAAAKYSVRKESTNSRKKARDAERARKEAEKKEREIEKARLRKLRIAEAEEKIQRIKDAAGLRVTAMGDQDWSALLNESWDNEHWEEEMRKKFGDEYYADHDVEAAEEGKAGGRKIKKPKWQDDIEINDLIPDFEHEQETADPQFSLTDEEFNGDALIDYTSDDLSNQRRTNGSGLKSRDLRKRKEELKKEARKERRKIEQIVDEKLAESDKLSSFGNKTVGHFRYRETSPLAYGLTVHDILMADDSQLNQFVGLKKLAAFRAADKKKRDKKRLGKKARLRQWRKDTFGDENGPQVIPDETIKI
jgi:protein KRI1